MRYEDPGGDKSLETALRVTLPKKWMERGSEKVVSMFVDAFNAKHRAKLDARRLKLYGDKSREAILGTIGEGLKDEETVWVRSEPFATSKRQLTDYSPRSLAKKDDLETARAKNQDFLCERATQVLELFGLPSDEDHSVVAVRRVVDERMNTETLICKVTSKRVFEMTTLVELPGPMDEYADAQARAWTQLGSALKMSHISVGPYLPLKNEHGKVAGQIFGRRWLCTFYRKREPVGDPRELGRVLGELHRVARTARICEVAKEAATLAPREWREEVLPNDKKEDTLIALDIQDDDIDTIFDDLPECWNHTDFRRDWCAKVNDTMTVVDGCCEGRLRPRVCDLLTFFTELLPCEDDVTVRLEAMALAFEAYQQASQWPFSSSELRLCPEAWKLLAQNDADILADIEEVAESIRKVMRESMVKMVADGPSKEPESGDDSDGESDYGEPEVRNPEDVAPADEPEPEEYWARLRWHDKYPSRYDLLRQKLVKKVDIDSFELPYEDIFLEHHVKRAPLREFPDPRPLVYSSNLMEGAPDAPRPMYLDHIPTVRWRVAAIVLLLLRDRERQENTWDTILSELPATLHRAVDSKIRKRLIEKALKQKKNSLLKFSSVGGPFGYLRRGHVAQCLSHIDAWRRFLEETTTLEHCIILEDDADVNFNFKDIFGAILTKFDDICPDFEATYDLLYLRVPWDDYRDDKALNINEFLNAPYDFSKLTGYMISRRGAKKLLNLTNTHDIDRPLPALVNHWARHKTIDAFVLRNRGLIGDKGQHPKTLKNPSLIKWWGDKIKSRIDNTPVWVPPSK